jgi:hypothetical protein
MLVDIFCNCCFRTESQGGQVFVIIVIIDIIVLFEIVDIIVLIEVLERYAVFHIWVDKRAAIA